jgi:hypothetical protein
VHSLHPEFRTGVSEARGPRPNGIKNVQQTVLISRRLPHSSIIFVGLVEPVSSVDMDNPKKSRQSPPVVTIDQDPLILSAYNSPLSELQEVHKLARETIL